VDAVRALKYFGLAIRFGGEWCQVGDTGDRNGDSERKGEDDKKGDDDKNISSVLNIPRPYVSTLVP
jgi:hypothetical protein